VVPSVPIPEGSVIITPLEMYHKAQETQTLLLNVSMKLDTMDSKFDHYQEDQSRRMDAIDGKDGTIVNLQRRVTSLERWRWISTGAVAMLSSGATAAVFQAVSKR